MPADVTKNLKEALSNLAVERQRIDHQTAAIQEALRAINGTGNGRGLSNAKTTTKSKRRGRRMSLAERKAVARRMKAYWAKKRARMDKRKKTTA